MYDKSCQSWEDFKRSIASYADLEQDRKVQIIFRGHANADWKFVSTFDRLRHFRSSDDREASLRLLLGQFRRCAAGLGAMTPTVADPQSWTQWELLARHHGVPTTVLDWTQSPWVAAFFAFDDEAASTADRIAIWGLDREVFAEQKIDAIELIDDESLLFENVRAVEQEALFMRIRTLDAPVEQHLEGHLFRYTIPTANREHALRDLDDMRINRRTLFRDLDGAAITATRRELGYVRPA